MPAAGFYEWQVQPDGTKQPYIQPAGDGEVFSIAALWDRSRSFAERVARPNVAAGAESIA